jgi:hypothetical protein
MAWLFVLAVTVMRRSLNRAMEENSLTEMPRTKQPVMP